MAEKILTNDSVPLLSGISVQAASETRPRRKLASGLRELDDFLGGGLPVGAVSEWGMPLGQGGRSLLVSWLAHLISPAPSPMEKSTHIHERGLAQGLTLWCYARAQLQVYPPAWLSRGVALQRVRFACTAKPLADLRPVFLEPLFKVIVIDSPRGFTEDDCAFLARRARANGQTILLLRDFFLGEKRGNVWAPLRFNCWVDCASQQFRLRVVRGLSPRQLALNVSAVERPASVGF